MQGSKDYDFISVSRTQALNFEEGNKGIERLYPNNIQSDVLVILNLQRARSLPLVNIPTGCTGLLGHHLLFCLLSKPTVPSVICLAVRDLSSSSRDGHAKLISGEIPDFNICSTFVGNIYFLDMRLTLCGPISFSGMNMYFSLTVFPFLACLIRADLLENLFIYPQTPGPAGYYKLDLEWQIGSTQTIQWTSNFSQWILSLYHNDGIADGSPVVLTTGVNIASGQEIQNYTWVVETAADLSGGSNNTFWLRLGGQNGQFCQSHYVNLTTAVSSNDTGDSTTSASPTIPSSVSTSISSTTTAVSLAIGTTAGPTAKALGGLGALNGTSKSLVVTPGPLGNFSLQESKALQVDYCGSNS
ncbi:hypothetical protein B7494_g7347 [Chlorociboria aeruginascens]|nr:hypothetical protein B7494_g7347 [Chlorociboria aeruginascens]